MQNVGTHWPSWRWDVDEFVIFDDHKIWTESCPDTVRKVERAKLIAESLDKATAFSKNTTGTARSREKPIGRRPIVSRTQEFKKCRSANLEAATWRFRLSDSAAWARVTIAGPPRTGMP